MIQRTIPEQIEDLKQLLEDAIQRVYMLRGAIQALEMNVPEEEETHPSKSDVQSRLAGLVEFSPGLITLHVKVAYAR